MRDYRHRHSLASVYALKGCGLSSVIREGKLDGKVFGCYT